MLHIQAYKQLAVFIFLWLVVTGVTTFSVDPFSLQRGFLYPDPFEGGKRHLEASAVFQNPARLSLGSRPHVFVGSHPDFIGYSQFQGAAFWPFPRLTVAMGYTTFFTDDIEGGRLDGNDRPITTGSSFSDRYQKLVFGTAYAYKPRIHFGLKAYYFSHELATDSASMYGADLGVLWQFYPGFDLGVYSRHLLGTEFAWEESRRVEDLTKRGVVELSYKMFNLHGRLSSDFLHHRLRSDLRLMPFIDLTGDAVVDSSMDLKRWSVGTVVYLADFSLSYRMLNYTIPDFQSLQHQIAVSLHFGRVVKQEAGRKRYRWRPSIRKQRKGGVDRRDRDRRIPDPGSVLR